LQVLLFMLDVGGFQLNSNSPKRGPADALRLLCEELDAYDATLRHNRPCVVAVNKMDTPGAQGLLEEFMGAAAALVKGMTVVPVSATEGANLEQLLAVLRATVHGTRQAHPEGTREQFVGHLLRPSKDALAYYREEAKQASFRRRDDQ